MSKSNQDNITGAVDEALVRRLQRLRTMPVDVARLEKMLEAEIPRPQPRRVHRWFSPLRAVAAGFVVFALMGVLLWSTLGGPVTASAAEMAAIHREMIRDPHSITQVDSMAEASAVLSSKWPGQPGLPQMPDADVMACCMHSIKNRKVACVQFKNDGAPVTMTVADASELRAPQSATHQRAGINYHVESSGDLNMVSVQRDGRWICLIGELSAERLIDIAQGLRFE